MLLHTIPQLLKMKYSLKYAILFSIISAAIAKKLFSIGGPDIADGWKDVWIYFGITTFITTYTLSYFFIEKKANYRKTRLIFIAILIVILSHWLSWYLFGVITFMKAVCNGLPLDTMINPINGIPAAAVYSIVSLLFLAWLTIPISIALSFLLKTKQPLN